MRILEFLFESTASNQLHHCPRCGKLLIIEPWGRARARLERERILEPVVVLPADIFELRMRIAKFSEDTNE